MSAKKPITEAYERDGLRVEPMTEDERQEWFLPFPSRRRQVGGKRPDLTIDPWRQRPTLCGESVHQGRASHDCQREAIAMIDRYGRRTPVCAQHLAGAQRRATNDMRKAHERNAQRSAEEQARDRVRAIAARLGIPTEAVDLDYMWTTSKYSTTTATITIDQLEAAADRYEAATAREEA